MAEHPQQPPVESSAATTAERERQRHDEVDARLVRTGDYARLLAAYYPVILDRCLLKLRQQPATVEDDVLGDAYDVANTIAIHLLRELVAGKRYSAPFRVIVHKRIDWTIATYFKAQYRLPLPEPNKTFAKLVDPRDDVETVEGELGFAQLIADLPPRQRQVIELRWSQGLEPEQIASELGMTRNAVDQALHQGHRKLRSIDV